MRSSKAKIFLADERGLNETDWLRSCNSFTFGKYQDPHKKPFSDLYVLNDDTLAGGRSLSMLIEEATLLVVIPVSGAIEYSDNEGRQHLVAAGQILSLNLSRRTTISFKNPFSDDPVNFLQCWFRHPQQGERVDLVTFPDLNARPDQLTEIIDVEGAASVWIGKFNGRGETFFIPKEDKVVFLFVLDGAFEAEGRLLHPRDGLLLWDTKEIDMEALSQDALLLLFELPMQTSLLPQ